jgi:hypothetical protein
VIAGMVRFQEQEVPALGGKLSIRALMSERRR